VKADLRAALAEAFGSRVSVTEVPSGDAMRQRMAAPAAGHAGLGLIGPGRAFGDRDRRPAVPLAVGTLQPCSTACCARGRHADRLRARRRRARTPGPARWPHRLHLPALGKSELLTRVVRDGPLPRKTFSMGEAHEKRFYVEARRIR
jgi:hypothetical protein